MVLKCLANFIGRVRRVVFAAKTDDPAQLDNTHSITLSHQAPVPAIQASYHASLLHRSISGCRSNAALSHGWQGPARGRRRGAIPTALTGQLQRHSELASSSYPYLSHGLRLYWKPGLSFSRTRHEMCRLALCRPPPSLHLSGSHWRIQTAPALQPSFHPVLPSPAAPWQSAESPQSSTSCHQTHFPQIALPLDELGRRSRSRRIPRYASRGTGFLNYQAL